MLGFSLTLTATRAAVGEMNSLLVGFGRAVVAAALALSVLWFRGEALPERRHLGPLARTALGVVIAAEGYPGTPRQGDAIAGLDADAPGTKVFHAATREQDGVIVSAGGRVLTVCALGTTFAQARALAYARAERIRFSGSFYRRDIGHRALARR